MRLVKLLANLGYGSRKEMQTAIRHGWVTDRQGNRLKADARTAHEDILFDDEPLNPAQGAGPRSCARGAPRAGISAA